MSVVPRGFVCLDGIDGHVYVKVAKVGAIIDWTPLKGKTRTRLIVEAPGATYEVIVTGTSDEIAEILAAAKMTIC